jgi:uncharacterized OB-fold protein
VTADPVQIIQTPIRLEYNYTPGVARSRFLNGLAEGRILGERCERCHKVYVGGGSGACPRDGIPMTDVVELPHVGTLTTFCVVNVPFAGATVEIPYTSGQVLLDGADIPLMGLLQEIPADQVRMGLRVEAVWAPEGERGPTSDSIRYWRPTGEPDAPIDDVLKRMRADA